MPTTTHLIRYRETANGPLLRDDCAEGRSFNDVVEMFATGGFDCAEVDAVFAHDEANSLCIDVSRAVANEVVAWLNGARDSGDDLSPGVSLFLHNNATRELRLPREAA